MKRGFTPIAGAALLAVLVVSNTGCDLDAAPTPSTARLEMAQNESNQQRMIKAVPTPALQTSLERKNLARRLEQVNKESMSSFIYLISYGKVMAFYAVSGKVSSLNSYMTAMERVEKFGEDWHQNYGPEYLALEAPDQDGTYGHNVEGIFFFTTDGAYVEWNGEYIWSNQPLSISQPPELVQQVQSR